VIRGEDGRVVWDNDSYDFLRGEAPDTVKLAGRAADPATLKGAGIEVSGDAAVLSRLLAVLDNPDPDFAVVTPEPD
jgi:alkyl sulfatase BDS1-like metallo-beta-lactamase superfamily hydrolase